MRGELAAAFERIGRNVLGSEPVIPVYINNFNRLASTRALVEWFTEADDALPIVVDNASDYPPLLDWYRHGCACPVVRLGNVGRHAPWSCGAVLSAPVHRALFGSDFYAVTDADLSLEGCPSDLLEVLADGIRSYPDACKVGVGLEIDDLPRDFPLYDEVVPWERQFWTRRRDARFFEAAIDTTLALYSIDTPLDLALSCAWDALRTDRPYVARHLPWYLRPGALSDEERYVLSTTVGGHWSERLKRAFLEEEPSR